MSGDEFQSEYNYVLSQLNDLWKSTISHYMGDTIGSISKEEMKNLLIDYQPNNVERFASILLEDVDQDWVIEENSANFSEVVIVLPNSTEEGLPLNIQEWFESDFFATASNTNALNSLYIAQSAIHDPYIPMPEVIDGEAKSADGNSEDSKISVQPNPFKDNVTFNLKAYKFDGIGNRLEFYDLLGKKVHEEMINENQVNAIIQGNKLPEGIILFTLFVNNSPVENGKIIRVK